MTNKRQQIEAAHGKHIIEVLRDLRQAGHTQKSAAAALGVSERTIYKWVRDTGFRWGRGTIENLRRGWEANTVRVMYEGRLVTLRELADLRGLPVSAVRKRYSNGDRGLRLWRPAKRYTAPQSVYVVVWSERDWQTVLAYARRHSIKAASAYWGVPYGAIAAALRGEWMRVA